MIKRKRNIETICEKMGWRRPMFCDSGANGYLTWKKLTQEDVDEIKVKTGINCTLTHTNRLVVPYYID